MKQGAWSKEQRRRSLIEPRRHKDTKKGGYFCPQMTQMIADRSDSHEERNVGASALMYWCCARIVTMRL